MYSRVACGRRLRPHALILSSVALVASIALAGAPAHAASINGATPSVRASQVLASLLSAHDAHAAPSARAPVLAFAPARTPITGERSTLPVLAQRGRWLLVLLPGRPNEHAGWIAEKGTVLRVTDWHIVVDTSRRQVDVYRSGKRVRTFEAVIGKPATPTPVGEFFIEESVALRPTDVGAPFALALSARSNVLQEFDGGPGQIAVHGVSNVGGVLGTAASHGCIRLSSVAMRWLAGRVGPGVPVTVDP
jgi:lipoprotein-anchoring transpeptidase ErfK/SrfK